MNCHIEKLLANHDYVVVPGLGGFITQSKPAVILSNSITPPLQTIAFNPLMTHADGLLAIEIARTESISYRAAVELVDLEVAKIKLLLQNSGSYTFGELGILSQTNSGRILFTPIYKADFLPANYGLSDLTIAKKTNYKQTTRSELTFKLPTVRMYKYAAAAMIIFGLLFVAPEVNDTYQRQTSDISTLLPISKSNTNINSSIKKASETAITDSVKNVEPAHYHVIVASLPTLTTADKYCAELKAANFSEVHVLSAGKTFRVAIQSFQNLDTAIEQMENLRIANPEFETAWVYCE